MHGLGACLARSGSSEGLCIQGGESDRKPDHTGPQATARTLAFAYGGQTVLSTVGMGRLAEDRT